MNNQLLNLIKKQFKLDLNGDHGIRHWENVARVGEQIAGQIGADKEIVGLFAYLHDAKREEDLFDSGHGIRAADFVEELAEKGLISLSPNKLQVLRIACRDHNNSATKSKDITIQACWDADRLDLTRVGIKPDPAFLYTALARSMAEEKRL